MSKHDPVPAILSTKPIKTEEPPRETGALSKPDFLATIARLEPELPGNDMTKMPNKIKSSSKPTFLDGIHTSGEETSIALSELGPANGALGQHGHFEAKPNLPGDAHNRVSDATVSTKMDDTRNASSKDNFI